MHNVFVVFESFCDAGSRERVTSTRALQPYRFLVMTAQARRRLRPFGRAHPGAKLGSPPSSRRAFVGGNPSVRRRKMCRLFEVDKARNRFIGGDCRRRPSAARSDHARTMGCPARRVERNWGVWQTDPSLPFCAALPRKQAATSALDTGVHPPQQLRGGALGGSRPSAVRLVAAGTEPAEELSVGRIRLFRPAGRGEGQAE
jgi:hypothetical protein